MSILKHSASTYVVWDNTGNYARFIGTLAQCRTYKKENK